MSSSTLDSYISSSTPSPKTLATSSSIRDRGSTFVGSLYRLPSSPSPSISQARKIHAYHKNVYNHSHKASHEIAAWRIMSLKDGCDGLGGPDDFELVGGWEDDGEDHGGKTVLKTMEKEAVIDAVVIVSRWFGGTLLGPVRFAHIETCTREVCRTFKAIEEVEGLIEQLKELDDQLALLRDEVAAISPQAPEDAKDQTDGEVQGQGEGKSKKKGKETILMLKERKERPDYPKTLLKPTPDVAKARRLMTARQNAIRSVKAVIAKLKENAEPT